MWQRARWGLVGLGARPSSQSTQRGGLCHGMRPLAGLPLWPGSMNLCLQALQVVGPYTSVRLLSHHIIADNLVFSLYILFSTAHLLPLSLPLSLLILQGWFIHSFMKHSETKANNTVACDTHLDAYCITNCISDKSWVQVYFHSTGLMQAVCYWTPKLKLLSKASDVTVEQSTVYK